MEAEVIGLPPESTDLVAPARGESPNALTQPWPQVPARQVRQPEVVRDAPRAVAPAPELGLAYRHSESIGRVAMALAQAQGEFQEIEKTLTAKVESRREGARSYTYQYTDLASVLAAVRPALSKYGLALMQFPSVRAKSVVVTTMLAHGESGEWIQGDLVVALDNLDPQAVGSATTYARRYGVTALLGVAAGEQDDDGQAAMKRKAESGAPPEGFETFWLDMEALADEGWARVESTWAGANGAFKNHVAKHMPEKWHALKRKALDVDKAAKGGAR